MAGTWFNYKLTGIDQKIELLKAAGIKARQPKSLMNEIGEYLMKALGKRMRGGIGPAPWTRPGGVFLNKPSSELYRSFTVKGHPNNIFKITGNRVQVGSSDFRAGVHDRGALIFPRRAKYLRFFVPALGRWFQVKSVRIPRRPITEYSPEDRAAVKAIADNWITQELMKLWR